jgi:hypothetical protein
MGQVSGGGAERCVGPDLPGLGFEHLAAEQRELVGAASGRIKPEGWGKGTAEAPSAHLRRSQPSMRGFSQQNLWRVQISHR